MARGLCILVFGVSGVGKTSSCTDYVARHPEWLYLRASALLSDATGESAEALRTSSEDAILRNQRLLGVALKRARAGREASPVLIDAHAVIDNDRDLVTVPVDAVASLYADGIVLLELSATMLAARRAGSDRLRPTRSAYSLDRESRLESAAVRSYATALGIPFARGKVEGDFRLDPLIDELVRRRREHAS
ncbi:AAA family ATPase [Novosphingobium sp. 9U]|uniref:AAA family ATPase n=1 Tax=Novosphingobium sp. 9U TaxID=2653158 RepID=UPI0012F249B5|nr:AAA family ATPase [Novosphingobium sp. 9U]VWX50863.1 conserved hypothetical protein [Novosphingobium sp. 9U]